jgi:hypothetical protein
MPINGTRIHQTRKNTLTDDDIRKIEDVIDAKLEQHTCRFPDMTPDEMAKIKLVANGVDIVVKGVLDKIGLVMLAAIVIVIMCWRNIKTFLGGG